MSCPTHRRELSRGVRHQRRANPGAIRRRRTPLKGVPHHRRIDVRHHGPPAVGQPPVLDGVPIQQVLEDWGRTNVDVRMDMSRGRHRYIWQEYMGQTGEPLVAFEWNGEIHVDFENLTAE